MPNRAFFFFFFFFFFVHSFLLSDLSEQIHQGRVQSAPPLASAGVESVAVAEELFAPTAVGVVVAAFVAGDDDDDCGGGGTTPLALAFG